MNINYEDDRVESVKQIDAAASLSEKVIELKNIEDEIENAEKSVSQLKLKAKDLIGLNVEVNSSVKNKSKSIKGIF